MFVKNSECQITQCEPGVTRKVMAYSDNLMMCEITFEKGAKGNIHSHPHLQITYVAEGSFEFTIDGITERVNKGDSVYMQANAVHGVVCLEPGILVDVFNPKREDFIK